MLLIGFVAFFGRIVGLAARPRNLLALATLALYVPLVGAGPSIQRAGVMGAAVLVATFTGRKSSRWYVLGLAAVITLLVIPMFIYERGGQLSLAAVVGLFCFATPWRQSFEARRMPKPVAEALAVTLAATATTAPLAAFHFSQFSLVSPLANVLAAPVV